MITRKSGILALVLGVAVLGAACESKEGDIVIPPTPVPVTVRIAPAGPITLNSGQTLQLTAVVTGSTNQAVTWAVASGTSATVSAAGLVTASATATGPTVIRATSQADPTALDAVTVTVQPGTSTGTPTVSIQAININGTTVNVNPGNVVGTIDVIANVDIPTGVQASAVRVTVDGTEVCRQSFQSGGSAEDAVAAVPVTITCTINTAQLAANGTPVFANGTRTIRVEVLGPTNTVLASATSQPLIFNNVNFLAISATASGATANDGAGLQWKTGDLTVSVTPGIFTGGAVSSVTVTVFDSINGQIAQQTLTTATNGVFSTTFTKAANTTNPNLSVSEATARVFVTVTSVQGGNPGPSVISTNVAPALRLDNVAPAINTQPAIPNGTWFGAAATLTALRGGTGCTGCTAIAAVDAGVNVNTFAIQFRATGTTNAFVTAAAVTDIPETDVSAGTGAWDIRVQVCDALQNCANSSTAGQTGFDRTAPIATVDSTAGVGNQDINSGGQWVIAIQEDRSGITGTPLMTTVIRSFPSLSAAGACVIGSFNAGTGACSAVATAQNVAIPGAEGYYKFTTVANDRALNTSNQIVLDALVDFTAPAVGPIGIPLSITGNGSATFTTTVTDNLDLRAVTINTDYSGPGVSLFAASTTVGAGFDGTLTTSANANATVNNFIRALLTSPNTVGSPATGVTATVTDVAGNSATRSESFQAGVVAAPTTAEFTEVASFGVSANPTEVCANPGGTGCSPANNRPSSTTLSAAASSATGQAAADNFNNPASRVNFYRQLTSGAWELVGTATAALSTTTGSGGTAVRTYTWSLSVPASAMTVGGNTFMAVAVNSAGSGLLSAGTVAVTRTN